MKTKFVASVARFESIVFELRAMFDLNDEYEKRDAPVCLGLIRGKWM